MGLVITLQLIPLVIGQCAYVMPLTHRLLLTTISSVVQLEVRMTPPTVLLLFSTALALLYVCLFLFSHRKLRIVLSRSVKNCDENLMGLMLNLEVYSDKMVNPTDA